MSTDQPAVTLQALRRRHNAELRDFKTKEKEELQKIEAAKLLLQERHAREEREYYQARGQRRDAQSSRPAKRIEYIDLCSDSEGSSSSKTITSGLPVSQKKGQASPKTPTTQRIATKPTNNADPVLSPLTHPHSSSRRATTTKPDLTFNTTTPTASASKRSNHPLNQHSTNTPQLPLPPPPKPQYHQPPSSAFKPVTTPTRKRAIDLSSDEEEKQEHVGPFPSSSSSAPIPKSFLNLAYLADRQQKPTATPATPKRKRPFQTYFNRSGKDKVEFDFDINPSFPAVGVRPMQRDAEGRSGGTLNGDGDGEIPAGGGYNAKGFSVAEAQRHKQTERIPTAADGAAATKGKKDPCAKNLSVRLRSMSMTPAFAALSASSQRKDVGVAEKSTPLLPPSSPLPESKSGSLGLGDDDDDESEEDTPRRRGGLAERNLRARIQSSGSPKKKKKTVHEWGSEQKERKKKSESEQSSSSEPDIDRFILVDGIIVDTHSVDWF